jgi:hypothetical protein
MVMTTSLQISKHKTGPDSIRKKSSTGGNCSTGWLRHHIAIGFGLDSIWKERSMAGNCFAEVRHPLAIGFDRASYAFRFLPPAFPFARREGNNITPKANKQLNTQDFPK